MTPQPGHVPVLLQEAVEALDPRPDGVYVDGTFGAGGHSRLLSTRLTAGGRIIAFDRDRSAQDRAETVGSLVEPSITFVHDSFASMAGRLALLGVSGVAGVLLDLGISSLQLDNEDRGFSFLRDGPLDMRLDPTSGDPASMLIERLDESEISNVLFRYGEERQARRIARAIVAEREHGGEWTTGRLARLVESTIGRRPGARIHPATRTFQALRIAVNDELSHLSAGLDAAIEVLEPSGRLVVVSFHSLEDRIVKQFIAREVKGCVCPPDQPVCTCGRKPRLSSVGKPVRPSESEVAVNPRSRSAIMRVAERLP